MRLAGAWAFARRDMVRVECGFGALDVVADWTTGLTGCVQCADHSETMNRWAGKLHDAFGSNMWS